MKGDAMTSIMSPSESDFSPITHRQCSKWVDVLVSGLGKSGLPAKETQQVLESQASILTYRFIADLRARVEAVSKMIMLRIEVNRESTPEEMVKTSHRNKLTMDEAIAAIPREAGKSVNLFFFQPDDSAYGENGVISDDSLAKEYELRGLVPDPRAQFAANEADPAFADDHPNGCIYKTAAGTWCFMSFYLTYPGKERYVHVSQYGTGWKKGCKWWFAGVIRR